MKDVRSFVSMLLVMLLVCAGCGPTYRSGLMKRLPSTWNEEQKLAALYFSYRLYFAEKLGPDSNQFVVFYPRQMTADILKQLEKSMTDFNAILDYNKKEWAQYLAYHKLRKDFEREETAIKALHARVQASNLDDKFQELMGTRAYDPANHSGRYNPKRLFLERDIVKAFPFTSSLIEEAKARGTLKLLEQFTVHVNQPFHHQAPDPNDPESFPKKFIWIPLKYDLELTNYKIVADAKKVQRDNKGHYIEGFRVIGGKKEEKPALKIFFPQGAPMGVLLADTEKTGEAGYGVPNVVERIMANGIEDIVMQNGKMLSDLFLDKKKSIRIPPKPKPSMVAEVVQVGSPVNVWEDAPTAQGWIVPFNYPNNLKDNYNVRVLFQRNGNQPPSPDRLKHIEAFVKEWTSGNRYAPSLGSVLEFYKPKSPFDQEVQSVEIGGINTKEVILVTKDGDQISGQVVPRPNKFIENAPYAVVYKEGEIWYRIEKQGGSAVFNKRRKTAPPKYQTGIYNTDEGSESSAGSNGSDGSGGHVHRQSQAVP